MTIEIRVLGPGCVNCQKLLEKTREAVAALGMDANVEEIHDVAEIVARGALSTPALVVNDELVMAGHVPSVPRLQQLLSGVG
jgi:small redox-active disulfide protein 2